MSEQQSDSTTATAVSATTTSACPHPEAIGKRWGDPISKERQAELDALAEQQRVWSEQPEAFLGESPFGGAGRLTGADVFWLAARALARWGEETDDVAALAAAQADLRAVAQDTQTGRGVRGKVDLRDTHLELADLMGAHLEGAFLWGVYLEQATLDGAHLEGARLHDASLELADLMGAHLEGAGLQGTHLEQALLFQAHLERADLHDANLQGTSLGEAHVEGADLRKAHLERADLTAASFDKSSRLNGAILTGASFDQVSFDNTNLTVVDWGLVDILGDEVTARSPKDHEGKPKDSATRLDDFKSAVRANRVLAVALRNQGLNEDADRFAYRAQLLQQQVLWRQRKVGGYFFSRFLDVLAGYGYYPGRAVLWYLATVLGFACVYYLVGHASGIIPGPLDAIVFSLTSFHGRGFFPSEKVSLHSSVIVLAALEAVIGLLIEISFIATFTQRFFGR